MGISFRGGNSLTNLLPRLAMAGPKCKKPSRPDVVALRICTVLAFGSAELLEKAKERDVVSKR